MNARLDVVLATLLLATSIHAAEYQGKVVSVADGDTITVLDSSKTQHKFRLNGIDAPEKGQPFTNRSRISLAMMVYQREVTIVTHKVDRYGREIGKVLRWPGCMPRAGQKRPSVALQGV